MTVVKNSLAKVAIAETAIKELQSYLEGCLANYLPYETDQNRLADAVVVPLEFLDRSGTLRLIQRFDSPARSYGGERRWRLIKAAGVEVAA